MGSKTRFHPILVSSISEDAWFTKIGDGWVLNSIIDCFYHPYLIYHRPYVEFQFKLASIFEKFHLVWKFG